MTVFLFVHLALTFLIIITTRKPGLNGIYNKAMDNRSFKPYTLVFIMHLTSFIPNTRYRQEMLSIG